MKKILLFITILLLTGCYNYHELNNIALVTGIAIDKKDDYLLTLLVANSKKNNSKEKSPEAIIYEGKGKTIYEAFKDASLTISKQIHLSHIEILIFSEEIAKNDLSNVLDFIFRYPQTKNNFQVAITKNEANKILKINIPNESVASNITKNLIKTDNLQGITYAVNFTEFIKAIKTKGIDPVLPSILIIGDNNKSNTEDNIKQTNLKANIKVDTMALFKDNKFITYSNIDESKGINIINNKIKILGIITKFNKKDLVIEINQMKSSFKIKNNIVYLRIKAKGIPLEINSDINLNNNKIIKEIENQTKIEITKYINKAFNLAIKNNTDIFGFNNYLYKNKKQFINLNQLKINTDIKLDIISKGSINNTLEVKNEN